MKRLNAARQAYEWALCEFKPFDLSKGDGEQIYRWSCRWMESELAAATDKAQRLTAFQNHLKRILSLEKDVHEYQGGSLPLQAMLSTAYYRAEAEAWVAAETSK